MKTLFTLHSILFIGAFAVATSQAWAQVPGDFQTKASGIWSDFNTWNVYNGTWIDAAEGQLPTISSNVFVQADHVLSVDNENAVCNNLNVNGSNTSKIAFSAATGILNVKGNMNLFSKSQNCFDTWVNGAKIAFSGQGNQGFTNLSALTGFINIEVNKLSGVFSASSNFIVRGTLYLTAGIMDIGIGGILTLNGASLVTGDGTLTGNSSSDLTIMGGTGDPVLLPLAGSLNLRNLTVIGTRTLRMDGDNDITISGSFLLGGTATYDNGGESQIINGGGSINIYGKFITKAAQGFVGAGAAIPGIFPVLQPGCIIEYGRMGDQGVQGSIVSFQGITFSGSGIKTPSSSFAPEGTVTITGSAILDATSCNVGDGTMGMTNLTMDGGKLILGTSGTQPMMNGDYNLTGGLIQFTNSDLTAQAIRGSQTYYAIEVTGTNVSNSSGNIDLVPGGSFTLKPGSKFKINTYQVTGLAGTQLLIEPGAIFECDNEDGFSGGDGSPGNNTSINSGIEIITLAPGSAIAYTGNGNQTISNHLAYQDLVISGTGNKTAPPGILTINGNLSNTGSVFVHNNGTVLFNNTTGSQSYTSATPHLIFYNLKDSSTGGTGLSVNSDMSIEGALTLGESAKLNLEGNITLISNEISTASVAYVPGSAIISYGTGLFIIERYITPKRAWRFLSVPSNTMQSVKDAWQEGALSSGDNPRPGYGTQITASVNPDVANGFDYYSNGSSVKKYDGINNTWDGISGTNIPIAPNEGLMTFVRGDRTANHLYAPATPTVLRTKGQLHVGTQVDIAAPSQKFTSIGNPYASALDMRKIIINNVNKTFYVWDPKLTGIGFGAYQTFTYIDNDFYPTPGFGSYGDPSMPYNYIQSGQAFFVYNSGSVDGYVRISESAKASADSPSVNNTFIFRPAGLTETQMLRTTLYRVKADKTSDVVDGVLNLFGNDFSNIMDKEDALKATNFAENLGIKNENKIWSIEKRVTIKEQDTIRLNLANLPAGSYRFVFKAANFNRDGLAWLDDSFTNVITPVNLDDSSIYNFNVVENAGSRDTERFSILFKNTAPLPVSFTSVKAFHQTGNILVQWNVENEKNIKAYVVEKSINGQQFTIANTLKSSGNNRLVINYQWLDKNPVPGENYYRIFSINLNGEILYSPIVKVVRGEVAPQISIIANPVIGNIINLQFINQPKGRYTTKLFNIAGQLLSTFKTDHEEGTSFETLHINKILPRGVYHLKISDDSNKEFTVKIVK